MIIRDIKYWNSYSSFNGVIVNGVSFLDSDQISLVYRACDANKNMLCDLFDKIGIKYDNISIMQEDYISYNVNGKALSLSKLSSGERFVLYLIACKINNIPVLAISLFERIGDRLMNVVYNELGDYDNLIVLWVNASYPKSFTQYWRD